MTEPLGRMPVSLVIQLGGSEQCYNLQRALQLDSVGCWLRSVSVYTPILVTHAWVVSRPCSRHALQHTEWRMDCTAWQAPVASRLSPAASKQQVPSSMQGMPSRHLAGELALQGSPIATRTTVQTGPRLLMRVLKRVDSQARVALQTLSASSDMGNSPLGSTL